VLGIKVEAKRQERLRIPEWLRQTLDETPEGLVPLLTYRRSGEEWMAVLPLETLLELLDQQ